MNNILGKIKFLLEKLSSRPKFDGLEINESALKYVFMEFDKPKMVSLRLPPGIFKDNKLQEPNQLLESLNRLHKLVAPDDPERIQKVTLVLPPGSVYTQSFNIPNVGEERMKETVTLNLQMISPMPVADANMSAQIIRETPDRYDLLGAFADRNTVNQLKDLITQAHFTPIAFEFPALSLTRLIRRSVKLNQRSTLVFQISSDGLDIFILREGRLYFNYFHSWRSIQGDARTISREAFDGVVIDEVKRVMDFSMSRFNEAPDGTIVIAPGFESEVIGLLEKNFNIKAVPLVLNDATPAFYTALGAAMRGRKESEEGDFEAINLGGESLTRAIYEEQIFGFISLWRDVTAGIFLVLMISFIFADSFLISQSRGLENQLAAFSYSGSQKELSDLSAKMTEFNGLVSTIRSVRGTASPWYELLSHLGKVADSNNVKIKSLGISSISSPIDLYGTADSYDTAFDFKNALASDSEFTNVNLPITQISIGTNGTASFSLSLQFKVNH
ncbi:MAG: hypothetical protein ABSF47_01750 [Minisyncoccia bacterium]|jgi:hypothetical protein